MYQTGTMQFISKSSRWQHLPLPQCSPGVLSDLSKVLSTIYHTLYNRAMKMALNVFFFLFSSATVSFMDQIPEL